MHAVHVILWVIGCVCLALAAVDRFGSRVNLLAFGLLAAVLNPTIDVLRH